MSVANDADELPMESVYQTSALFAFFTDKFVPCLGLGSIEWEGVTLLKILIQVSRCGRETWREDRIVFAFLPMNLVLYIGTRLVGNFINYLELFTVTQRRKIVFVSYSKKSAFKVPVLSRRNEQGKLQCVVSYVQLTHICRFLRDFCCALRGCYRIYIYGSV